MQEIKERVGWKLLAGITYSFFIPGMRYGRSFSLRTASGGLYDQLAYSFGLWEARREDFGPYCLYKTQKQAYRERDRSFVAYGLDKQSIIVKCLYIKSREKKIWCPVPEGFVGGGVVEKELLPPGTVLADEFKILEIVS